MTREEAKQMFRDDKNSYGAYKAVMSKINKIYDDFENESPPIHILEGITNTCVEYVDGVIIVKPYK